MLQKAVYLQLILVNPAERVQPPKTRKPKRRYYDDEQSKALVSNLMELTEDQIKYKVAIILTLFTGVRRGELLGLTWDDIDFKTGKVVINISLQYAYGKTYEKETKTENSERVNYISEMTLNILKQWKKRTTSAKITSWL